MTIKQRVEAILKVSRMARNSDRELYIIYMQKAGLKLTPEQVELYRSLPSTDTLGRIRRKLQEEGKYPADPEVNEARYNKFVDTTQNINHVGSPEELLEKQGKRVLPWGQ